MSAILKEDPSELSNTNQNISPGVERLVNRCLEKNPEARFHSASDLAFALEALAAGSVPSNQHAAGVVSVPARLKQRDAQGGRTTLLSIDNKLRRSGLVGTGNLAAITIHRGAGGRTRSDTSILRPMISIN